MKLFHFAFWAIGAVFILPCVFVATIVYPKWEEWGKDF